MRPISEALSAMMPRFAPRGAERLPLAATRGRFLSSPVRAREDSPAFDNSAMDGWAVRSADLASASSDGPAELEAVGTSRAGGESPPAVGPGTTVRIFTGAPMPDGADAVVMQEHVHADGGRARFERGVAPGANLRARASDLEAGRVMLPAGAHLAAGEIALLASQRIASVDVHRRPHVAVLCTGDELRDLGDPVEPGTIVNSNAYELAAQIEEAGGAPWVLPQVGDDAQTIARAVQSALDADVVVSVGGASVGEHDVVKGALEAAGVTLDFWKVKMKPGKPLLFGVAGDVPVVGLPGNPVSALVTFEVFVRPGIRRMLGDPRPHRARHRVTLTTATAHRPGRTELARACVQRRGDRLEATLLRLQGSGSLPSVVGFDALVILPGDVERFDEGTELDALLVRDGTGSPEPPIRDGA